MLLPDIQMELVDSLECEFRHYLAELETRSKGEIICESERTSFYGNLISYVREKILTNQQIEALSKKDSLNKAYCCYLSNDYNTLDTINNFGRLIYQFTKEQNQTEMS